ncbi:MAG: GTP-binding protein, partial [Ignavibacteria bacterium]
MKEYSTESIRNIAFVGHGGSGKTSLSELVLYTARETTRIGKIEEGNTISDYSPNEIEKQISISTGLMHIDWNNCKINLLDTPGYSDFTGDVKSALKVAETAVILVKSAEGIEVGTEVASGIIKEYKLPASIIINKVDNEHSTFEETFDKTKERISSNATIVTFPAAEGINFNTVVDVVKMKAFTYGDAGTKKISEGDIPGELKEIAENYRTELIEKVAETSEELMNKYFDEGSLSDEDLELGLKNAIISGSLVPVFAMSGIKGVGVNNFLDFVSAYFPSPADTDGVEATLAGKDEKVMVKPDNNGEPVLFVFKIISEEHVGEMSLFKVYSGTINTGMDLINVSNSKTERINQISILNGHHRKDVTKIVAGDIGSVVKLKDTHTNNTLASKNFSVQITPTQFPDPVIRGAIVPKAKGDEDKIASGLHTLHEEDPSFSVRFDP